MTSVKEAFDVNQTIHGTVPGIPAGAGSRVPPVTSLGLETAVPPGAAGRAFRVLASEGVLYWVPRLGYHVRTSITVAVSSRPRQDGGLTAVLPGGVRQQAGHGVRASSGTGQR